MKYLRIRNFWEYQNADAWKKAKQNKGGHRHPAWCKLYVARDLELDSESPMTRLVFYELLRLATVCGNVIPNDESTILNAISLPRQAVRQAIPRLLEGGWLCASETPRRSREPSRKIRAQKQKQIREEKITKPSTSTGTSGYVLPDFEYHKLVKILVDKDEGTEQVIRALARRYGLTEGDFASARELALMDGAESRTRIAVSELKKRGLAKEVVA